MALLDRCLITLCTNLPESLGLYNTPRDRMLISALREIPTLENLVENSKKHLIIRDWMQSYNYMEDQALSSDIKVDDLIKIGAPDDLKYDNERYGDDIGQKTPTSKAVARSNVDEVHRVSNEKRKKSNGMERDFVDIAGADEPPRSKKVPTDSKNSKDVLREKKLAPLEKILTTEVDEQDEDDDDSLSSNDSDVYEVETILDRQKGKRRELDMYLIKWVGYDEPTWEPARNVSKALIDDFDEKNGEEIEYVVDAILDRRRAVDANTGLRSYEYLVRWFGYKEATWEPDGNISHTLRRKFDRKYEAQKRRRTR